jgi:hypothetical protein
MKLVNSIINLAAAAALLPACVCVYAQADYEAPSDIEVSVGSYEIDRSQLGGDTLVEIPIYINNNCGFVSLNVLFELDSRLSFAGDYEAAARAKKLSGVNIYRCYDSGNAVSTCFEASGRSRFSDNGEIGVLRVNIPANTPAGEYGISMPDSAGDFEVMIFTHNSDDALFGRECFSALNGGSIIVTDKSREGTADHSDSGGNEEADNIQQPEPEADGSSDKAADANDAEKSTSTTASSTSTVTKTTSTVRSTISSESSETKTTASVTSVTETNTSGDEKHDLKKGKNRNMLAPIIAASLLLIGAAVAFVVKKGGRSK